MDMASQMEQTKEWIAVQIITPVLQVSKSAHSPAHVASQALEFIAPEMVIFQSQITKYY